MSSQNAKGASSPSPQLSFLPALSQSTLLAASCSLAILLVALFVYIARKKSLDRGSAVLLVGASDAGKTAILTTIVYNQTLTTHASMQTNSSVLSISPKKPGIRIIDVPGHPRLRGDFKDHLAEAKGVAFVVDASTITRNSSAVAEHLHLVLHALTSLPPTRNPPALCILAHKSDLLTASAKATSPTPDGRSQLATSRVRTILERELEKRRASHAGGVGVEGLGAEDESTEMGGLDCHGAGGGFRFADWEGGEVAFFGTSVHGEKIDTDDEDEVGSRGELSSFREWLEELS